MEPEGKGLKMLIDESNGVRTNQVDKDRVGKDREEQDRDGETVLHRAVAKLSFKDDTCNEIQVIKLLVENFPELVGEMRPNSTLSGQTPLHMAITKGASNVADILMESLRPDTDVFKVEVSGQIFRNTVMMAELPLSVAALKNDKTLFQNILKRWVFGAKLDARNSKGDNVCHSLIRYNLSLTPSLSLSLSLSLFLNYYVDVKFLINEGCPSS